MSTKQTFFLQLFCGIRFHIVGFLTVHAFFLDFMRKMSNTVAMKNTVKKAAEAACTKFDFHTHTIASGHATTDTIADMAKAASARGMTLLGISDHGPASIGSAGLSYFRSLSLAPRERLGIKIYYGAEANILNQNGDLDIPDDILSMLDYCIVSMHRPIYVSGSKRENTLAYRRAMEHPNVKIIGHCDDSRFPVDYAALVHDALQRGVIPELNNVSLLPDSYRKNCRENSLGLLQECSRQGCRLLLSSDSHGKARVGDVTEAWAMVRQADFPLELVVNPVSHLTPTEYPF